MSTDRAEINVARIPLGGGIGTGLAILVLLTGLLIDIPALRVPALGGIASGVALGLAMIGCRRLAIR